MTNIRTYNKYRFNTQLSSWITSSWTSRYIFSRWGGSRGGWLHLFKIWVESCHKTDNICVKGLLHEPLSGKAFLCLEKNFFSMITEFILKWFFSFLFYEFLASLLTYRSLEIYFLMIQLFRAYTIVPIFGPIRILNFRTSRLLGFTFGVAKYLFSYCNILMA